MDLTDETGTTLWAVAQPGEEKDFDWVKAHAKPQAGWEPHRFPVALFDPIPPSEPRPEWLLEELSDGDVVVQGRERQDGQSPDFQLLTPSGRDLGSMPRHIAGLIERVLGHGVQPEVSVFAAMSCFPPTPGIPVSKHLKQDLTCVLKGLLFLTASSHLPNVEEEPQFCCAVDRPSCSVSCFLTSRRGRFLRLRLLLLVRRLSS